MTLGRATIRGTPIVVDYLLNEFNASLKVHAKINEGPIDPLSFVLLLFQHEHVMVEELLKFLVGEVDTQLLEAVELREGDVMRVQKRLEEIGKPTRTHTPAYIL